YCLMPSYVHLIVTPSDEDGPAGDLCRGAPPLHQSHQCPVPPDGPFFSGRFGAVVMDEPHLLPGVCHIALNPEIAGLVNYAEDWPWSSAPAHLAGEDDELAIVAP